MISIISGRKGRGKTKIILDQANKSVANANGSVIFIDKDNSLMYELDRQIRLINIEEFASFNLDGFIGLIYGIISQDHDITDIFIDGLYALSNIQLDKLDIATKKLDEISKKFKVNFIISLSEDPENIPEFTKQFVKIPLWLYVDSLHNEAIFCILKHLICEISNSSVCTN